MDFIAIDFEIANSQMNSACSLGMVFVEDNKVVDKKYFLIQPPELDFDEEFTKIHGLTLEDLKDAPTFDLVWNEIKHHFHEESLMIAHNAQFDMSVFKNCLITYSLDSSDFPYACSIPISTRACRGEGIKNSLEARTERFGIIIDDHHNALSDAIACAELVIKCIEIKNRKSIHSYLRTFPSIQVRLLSELKMQTTFGIGKRKRYNRVSIKDVTTQKSKFDENHAFYDKNIVFTGDLQSIDRRDAMQMVVDEGAIIKSGMSRLVDYVIVGKQDKTIVGKDGMSSKERKALELIEQGLDIKVIKEDEFLSLLKYRKMLTMTEGRLYFFNKPDPNRPIEEKYVTEINNKRESFINQDDALLSLFDNGIKSYKYLTKEANEYKNLDNLLSYELWQLSNRVGYVLYDFESYVGEGDVIKKRKAYIWRFIGFGRSCFAETKEELKEKVIELIGYYNEDTKDYGHSTYPYYNQYYRD